MRRPMATTFARHKAAALAFGVVLLAAACGSGSGTSGGATSPAPATPSASAPASALCQDVAALRASLARLTHVTVGKDTANELNADLKDVKAALTTLANDASNQWNSQLSALKSALARLQTAVTGLASGTSSVTAVLNALGEVSASARQLFAVADTRCPSSSPSPSM